MLKLILFSFLLFSLACNQSDIFPDEYPPIEKHEFWLTDRLAAIGDKPIRNIAFPGAHDADSSQIGLFNDVCEGEISAWARLGDILGISSAYANTQGYSATMPALARAGIRFFDMRVCYYDNDFYGAHSLVSAPIFDEDLLGGFLGFAKSHPSELFFLRFQAQGSEIEQAHIAEEFANKFADEYADILISPENVSSKSSLTEVLSHGNVIAISGLNGLSPQKFWPKYSMSWSWPNTLDIEFAFEKELERINRRPGGLYTTYLDLTPTTDYIKYNLFSSIIDLAQSINSESIKWLKELPKETRAKFNIIAFDAVLYDPELVEEIIAINDDAT